MLALMQRRYWIFALLAVASAGAKEEFLPAEQAFSFLADSDGSCITVQWNVAPGYYLYKSRMDIASVTPGIVVGEPRYPKGEVHRDEFLGDQVVFRDDFEVTAPVTRAAGSPPELVLSPKLQGCADAGLCYPPEVRTVRIAVAGPKG